MPLVATRGAASVQGFGEFAQGAAPVYIEDTFSTYLYTGTGTTLPINNGIDLSGKGGLLWVKDRTFSGENNWLYDTARGYNKSLVSNTTGSSGPSGDLSSFNTNGFTVASAATSNINYAPNNPSPHNYVSWTFRKQPKFFDVVTYTGDGVAGRTVPHNLGSVPGVIIVKLTTSSQNWRVYHRALGATQYLELDGTGAAATLSTIWNNTAPTSTVFSVGTNSSVNNSGSTYVAYLFAHNAGGFGLTGTDNVISCGSYTGNGSVTGPSITLGYEPQWVLVKSSTVAGSHWYLMDTMRGMAQTVCNELYANLTAAEITQSKTIIPTATGFDVATTDGYINNNGSTYIYIAIRRGPMKTPTSGTSVFSPVFTSSATGTALTTNFPIDMQILGGTTVTGNDKYSVNDRLRRVSSTTTEAQLALCTSDTRAEFAGSNNQTRAWNNVGFQMPSYWGGVPTVFYNFRRAPGFFDEVCYTGTGVLRTITHNLGAVPELIIIKKRSAVGSWVVYAAPVGNTKALYLNLTSATTTDTSFWNNTSPTASVFTVNVDNDTNDTNKTQVAYLFATCVGVSKVGSYVGNGSSQTIPCGFTSGSRFVMIKRTDNTGDWYVWDSARGIVANNDPHLSLNTTAAEVTTDDSVDTDSTGFVVNQVAATNVNVTSAAYIFLAIA